MKKKRKAIKYTIDKNGCWICMSHARSDGYPVIMITGNKKKISRIMYEKYNGKIPEGYVMRHTCDVPSCINPNHLLIGTQQDNINDKVERGRQIRGEKSIQTNITDKQVLEMLKESNKPIKYLVEKYNIPYHTITNILKGRSFKHLLPKSFGKTDRRKKLTKKQKEEIRKSKKSGKALSNIYMVTEAMISLIRSGKA